MTSKRKLYREDEKLFFLHSYYQSGMSKHAFCRAHGICCPALLNSWIKKYSNLAEEPIQSQQGIFTSLNMVSYFNLSML